MLEQLHPHFSLFYSTGYFLAGNFVDRILSGQVSSAKINWGCNVLEQSRVYHKLGIGLLKSTLSSRTFMHVDAVEDGFWSAKALQGDSEPFCTSNGL